ncbi:hypothetical protein HG536_0F03790 [Torulaspora globosa]|uniref:Uncharacterized protein n=1 Tax=Torulaspora globosa TaxID=48254 RepID=A0A7G3ZKL8_9SACH|nr:uncharacterized protein HG536_0F03790 [Torulaspora globosa]QLL34054.1 hypothetical protein HG536_0F03790 [Torulaspora globosa]
MSDIEVDGPSLPNGIQSADTTLEDLLNDESLGCPSNFNIVGNEEQRHFQDCLAVFIRGDCEDTIQKMYEYGFLTQTSLHTTYKYFNLFLEACYSVSSFRSLGFRLQEVVHQTFTGDPQTVQYHLKGAPKNSQASMWSKYYSCCVRAALMNQLRGQQASINLENGARRVISSLAKETSGPDEAAELEKLVDTYIFGIQIEVLQKTPSTALYKQLCYHVPNLGSRLSSLRSIHKGKTVEEDILSRLETKPVKIKKQPRQHSKPVTDNKAVGPTSKPPLKKTRETNTVQVIPKWRSLWPKFFSKVYLSRSNLLLILFLFLASFQSIKKLAKIPRFFTSFLRNLAPHLKNLLRLLSTI